jgi:hypothetical protein
MCLVSHPGWYYWDGNRYQGPYPNQFEAIEASKIHRTTRARTYAYIEEFDSVTPAMLSIYSIAYIEKGTKERYFTVPGWYFFNEVDEGWKCRGPHDGYRSAINAMVAYHKQVEADQRVGIYCIEDENAKFSGFDGVGWYFADEAEQLNGPFGTREEAFEILTVYFGWLNSGLSPEAYDVQLNHIRLSD